MAKWDVFGTQNTVDRTAGIDQWEDIYKAR